MKSLLFKYGWLFLLWGLALFLMILFFPNSANEPLLKISSIIQAQSVVTLMLITWFYAIQTKYLVDEQRISTAETKRKTHIDFLERRINEFYQPFYLTLLELSKAIHLKSREAQEVAFIKNIELMTLLSGKRYMTDVPHEKLEIFLLKTKHVIKMNTEGFDKAQAERDEFVTQKMEILRLLLSDKSRIEKIINDYYFIKSSTGPDLQENTEAGAARENGPLDTTP